MTRKLAVACMTILLLTLSSVQLSAETAAPSPGAKTIVLSIAGMSCEGCATGIRAMLKRTSGVISADVNYEKQTGTVVYDSRKTNEAGIVEVVSKMGYKVAILK